MAGLLQCSERSFARRIGIVLQAKINKDTVVAIDVGLAKCLTFQRDQRLAILAGGFRDELLSPGAEIRDVLGPR